MRFYRPGGLAPGAAVPWGLVAIGIFLVAGFDMVAATPFHDEWMYRWTLLQAQTGFLSDGTYLGILALSMWAGVRWLQTGRGLHLFIGLALLGRLSARSGS